MPRRLWTCTPTKLDTWLACPRRYRFSYLDRRQKGLPWAHNSVGSSVHNALRDWWSLPSERRTPASASDLVAKGWLTDGFRNDAQSAEWRDRASAMTAAYVDGLDPDDDPIGVERTVATTTHGMALSGRVDRIDLRASDDGGDELVIVDYKTGRRPLGTDDAKSSLALAVYVVAARRTLRRRSRRVELHHLPTATVAALRPLRRVDRAAPAACGADRPRRAGGRREVARVASPPAPRTPATGTPTRSRRSTPRSRPLPDPCARGATSGGTAPRAGTRPATSNPGPGSPTDVEPVSAAAPRRRWCPRRPRR